MHSSSATEIPDDGSNSASTKTLLPRGSGEYVNMERGGQASPAGGRSLAASQTYWEMSYAAYAATRDAVTSTASWSWTKAAEQWNYYLGSGSSQALQESNLTLLKDLFGPTLVDAGGRAVNTEDALGNGRYVAIYVGAEWASPCVPLMANLQRVYDKVNSKQLMPVLEVVYVSADKTQEQFDAYMKTMPWMGLPWPKLQMRKKVMTIYKAATLPKFILLSPQGKVLTDDEKWCMIDPNGAKFPFQGSSESLCTIQ